MPESWDGTVLSRTSPIKHETKIMQWDVAAGKYKLVLKLFPHVRSIIDEALVDTATYAIYQSDVVVVPPGALRAAPARRAKMTSSWISISMASCSPR